MKEGEQMALHNENWSLMAFPDIWRQSLHRHIFCVLFHANVWILLQYDKGLDKPLTHIKTDSGLGSSYSVPDLWTRRRDTQEHSACCQNESKMSKQGADSPFPSTLSACLHFKDIPHNFTSQKDPTDPACWLCSVSPLFTLLSHQKWSCCSQFCGAVHVSHCVLCYSGAPLLLHCIWVDSRISSSNLLFISHPSHYYCELELYNQRIVMVGKDL